jgi:hypothetical protein
MKDKAIILLKTKDQYFRTELAKEEYYLLISKLEDLRATYDDNQLKNIPK